MRILIVAGLLICTACIGAGAQDPKPQDGQPVKEEERPAEQAEAYSLIQRESWVEKIEIAVAKSRPPAFGLGLSVQMPTPGWKLKVDEVTNPDAEGRIQVKITGTPPEGMVAQVITSETVSAQLGRMKTGEYLVEVLYRKAGDNSYTRRGAIMLTAGG